MQGTTGCSSALPAIVSATRPSRVQQPLFHQVRFVFVFVKSEQDDIPADLLVNLLLHLLLYLCATTISSEGRICFQLKNTFQWNCIGYYKEDRCLARYSLEPARHNQQPTGRQMNRQGLYEKVSDVPESRVWFAGKNLTPCRMH